MKSKTNPKPKKKCTIISTSAVCAVMQKILWMENSIPHNRKHEMHTWNSWKKKESNGKKLINTKKGVSEMKIKIIKERRVEKIPKGFAEAAKEECETQARMWENEGEDKPREIVLTVCEEIEAGKENEFVSLSIEADGKDGGYLHVFRWREK